MEEKELEKALEALLFVGAQPLGLKQLAEFLGLEPRIVKAGLENLRNNYLLQDRGIKIVEIAGGYQMVTVAEVASYIEKMRKSPSSSLSAASLETLAIIAYKQPLTRAEVENIRGVKSEKSLNTLLEKGLIKELGRKEAIGKPILYGTTPFFLQYFGLKDLADLPPLEEGQLLELEPES